MTAPVPAARWARARRITRCIRREIVAAVWRLALMRTRRDRKLALTLLVGFVVLGWEVAVRVM